MAEPLKNRFGADVPVTIARSIAAVSSAFPEAAFAADALAGYDALDLMARGRKIAQALRRHLPDDYEDAVGILVSSLGPKLVRTEGSGMAPFLYLPHVCFVAQYGLEHFEVSMHAQHELTQRFTAEFSIRPFLERHPEATLARLREWTGDPSPHVRRLVSEGTRPRLPWAPRLRRFQADPRPVLALLELLKDDGEPYVRRSVANNLNDIGKDHPALLAETARRWMTDATDARRALIRHALRSAVKRADPEALGIIGFGGDARVSLDNAIFTPETATIGGAVTIAFDVTNTEPRGQHLLVDLRVHFVKASGRSSPKVFKLRAFELAPGQAVRLRKSIALAEMTTRRHYAGTHRVDALVNGRARHLGSFELTD